MLRWVGDRFRAVYEALLERELDGVPEHVAVIQDGNRRYARERGDDPGDGHKAGAGTTEAMLDWCAELGIEGLTLYAFSTENFERPTEEREQLFDLLEEKLREFADADRVHDEHVRIRAIGQTHRLPDRVQEAIAYATRQTADYDGFTLNVALGYGGRASLLDAARDVCGDVAEGTLNSEEIDTETVADRLHDESVRDVDLILRTGGSERTSNFLPWHANGNEAAVYFCSPYWPEFSKTDFLRGIRTYQSRTESWRRTRAERALALLRAVGDVELQEARRNLRRFRAYLPKGEREDVAEVDVESYGD